MWFSRSGCTCLVTKNCRYWYRERKLQSISPIWKETLNIRVSLRFSFRHCDLRAVLPSRYDLSAGYSEDHNTIRLFWQVVEDFDDDQRRLLLKFVTSCSRQPLFGFKVRESIHDPTFLRWNTTYDCSHFAACQQELEPPFCIQKAGSTDRLPTASTCMNLLKMPAFEDYETLKVRLLYAIQADAGFELSWGVGCRSVVSDRIVGLKRWRSTSLVFKRKENSILTAKYRAVVLRKCSMVRDGTCTHFVIMNI